MMQNTFFVCEIKCLNKIYDLINKDVILLRVDGKMQVVLDPPPPPPPKRLRTTDLRSKFSTHSALPCCEHATADAKQLKHTHSEFQGSPIQRGRLSATRKSLPGNHPHPRSHFCQSKRLITLMVI